MVVTSQPRGRRRTSNLGDGEQPRQHLNRRRLEAEPTRHDPDRDAELVLALLPEPACEGSDAAAATPSSIRASFRRPARRGSR
jgi:hypothetical protein